MFRVVTRTLAVLAIVLMAGGCVTTLASAADSWIGAPIDDFIARAGPPDRVIGLENGGEAYSWSLDCRISMVTRQGLIQSWSTTNCPSFRAVPSSWIRRNR